MPIPYLSLDIYCKFLNPTLLPPFKGSTLRGAFGHSLKKVTCALRNQECESCLLAGSCAYALIFATEKLQGERIAARPHPYVLNPPMDERREYAVGDIFEFNIVLLGPAADFLPHIVYTVEEMGKNGIGKHTSDGAGRFSLTAIRAGDRLLYSDTDKLLHQPAMLPQLSLEPQGKSDVSALAIELLSPLRLKSNNGFQRSLSFPVIARAALRRLASLEKCYGAGDPDLDFRGLCAKAESITEVSVDVNWRDYKRYSSRQKSDMLFGGVVGRLEFAGEVAPFVPIFSYVQRVNLGKQTAFGLGRFTFEVW